MGNCLANNHTQNHPQQTEAEIAKSTTRSSADQSEEITNGKRFKLGEEGNNDRECKGGGVRIRVVVSKEELKQILRSENQDLLKYNCIEQLIRGMRLRDMRRRICINGGGGGGRIINSDVFSRNWKPDLETIPEDH